MFKLPVDAKEIVLEIGSGHNPHPRSDILVDRSLDQDTERQRRPIRNDRPLIIADGTKLPFADKSFDFVLCNQVLEHVEDPVQFTKEIFRVGKRGLLVTPSILRERIFGWHYHRWFIENKNNVLNIYPKKETQQTQFAHFIHVLFAHTLNFRGFIRSKEKELNIYYYWSDEIKVKINSNDNELVEKFDTKAGDLLKTVPYGFKYSITQWLLEKYLKLESAFIYYYFKTKRKIIRQQTWEILKESLVCINCEKGILKNIKNMFVCTRCNNIYKINNEIPIIL